MLRFWFVVIVSLPYIFYYLARGAYIERHDTKYTEERRYDVAQRVVRVLKRHGRISTDVYGTENLPADGGYIMYPNHQGKYDAVGIIYGHEKPCTIMMDEKRSHMIIMDQFLTLLKGCRINKDSVKGQVEAIRRVEREVKQGRKYIVFPEGGYYHNRNAVREFMPGAFKCAVRANCPIVPVLLIDSYKPFEVNSLKKVKTQVHYLPAIYPEEYKGLSTGEIAKLVRERIVTAMEERVA